MAAPSIRLALSVAVVVGLGAACVPEPGPNVAPVVNSGPSLQGVEGSDVVLQGSASDPDNGPGPLEISWSLTVVGPGDTASCTFTGTSSVNPTLNCTEPGNYLAQLRAGDGEAFTDDIGALVTFTVNQPPVVDSGPGQSGPAGSDLVLAGSASDPDNGPLPLEISWLLSVIGPGDKASCSFSGTDTTTPTLNCTEPGSYLAQLRAWDGLVLADDVGTLVTFT